jgi:hypothetical protein
MVLLILVKGDLFQVAVSRDCDSRDRLRSVISHVHDIRSEEVCTLRELGEVPASPRSPLVEVLAEVSTSRSPMHRAKQQ